MSCVFFYVQHLLGIGHLRRAAVLARALAAAASTSCWCRAGRRRRLVLDGVRFHQLPPLRAADESLRDLARLDGTSGRRSVPAPAHRGPARPPARRGAGRRAHRAVPLRPHAAALRIAAASGGRARLAEAAADRLLGARRGAPCRPGTGRRDRAPRGAVVRRRADPRRPPSRTASREVLPAGRASRSVPSTPVMSRSRIWRRGCRAPKARMRSSSR